jgi:hypothetical protein
MDEDLRVSLDRVEDGMAVLTAEDSLRWLVPAGYLPEGVKEGDVLRVSFHPDPEATERLAGQIRELQDRLRRRTEERHEQ